MIPEEGRPVVVIGASAGGIQALLELVAELPHDYGAPIFVVVHIGRGQSRLPTLIERAGVLPSSHARHEEPIRPGHIYVAPPDFHMGLRDGHIALSHGPRENHSRPAIDPLFRSAAAFGPRTTGIILSGALSDGVAGLMMIKARGGTAIVQNPDEAEIVGMPESAIRAVETDHILDAREIGRLLASMPMDSSGGKEERAMSEIEEQDLERIKQDFRAQERNERNGQLTMFTCPDCGGTLWQSTSGAVSHFRCHVGHAWGVEALLGNKSEELEAALWSSVRLLEERATLSRQVAAQVRSERDDEPRAHDIDEQANLDERRADAIRELLYTPLNVALQIAEFPDTGGPND
jgi:two-component system, chemotaxis family, protein-glutamate methylesterase/glutaminase